MADHYYGTVEFPTYALERKNDANILFKTFLDSAMEDPDFPRFDDMEVGEHFIEISGNWADGEHEDLERILKEFRIPYNASWDSHYEIPGGIRWFRPGHSVEQDIIGTAPKDGDGELYITATEVSMLMELSPVEFKKRVIESVITPVPPLSQNEVQPCTSDASFIQSEPEVLTLELVWDGVDGDVERLKSRGDKKAVDFFDAFWKAVEDLHPVSLLENFTHTLVAYTQSTGVVSSKYVLVTGRHGELDNCSTLQECNIWLLFRVTNRDDVHTICSLYGVESFE